MLQDGGVVSGSEYLIGVAITAAIVAPLWFAARRLQSRYGPPCSGALARLGESIIFAAIFLALSQTLGTVGLLRRVPLVLGALSIGVLIQIVVRDGASNTAPLTRVSARRRLATRTRSDLRRIATGAGAAIVVGLVVTPWIGRTLTALRTGVLGLDSLDYHLPFAARFAQEGRVAALHFTVPGLETAFHPANSELIHAVGMVAFRTDWLSPVMNLAWVSIALLAAWCVGLARHVSLATLAAAGVVLSCPLFVAFDGGRATNDIAGCAWFLAAVAVLLNGREERRATGLAAIAAGLALGDKLTLVVPVIALTLGVIAAASSGQRVATARVWLPWLLLSGGFWYVRNLIAVGSPIPALKLGLGAVALPSTEFERAIPPNGVAHYLLDPDTWHDGSCQDFEAPSACFGRSSLSSRPQDGSSRSDATIVSCAYLVAWASSRFWATWSRLRPPEEPKAVRCSSRRTYVSRFPRSCSGWSCFHSRCRLRRRTAVVAARGIGRPRCGQ